MAPSGGPWGGVRVDENFEQLLIEIFGEQFISSFKTEHSNDWLSLIMAFEKTKKCIDSLTLKNVRIPISWAMGTASNKCFNKSIDKVVKEKGQKFGVTFDNGSIVISETQTEELFKPIVNSIIKHLEKLLSDPRLNHLDYILLVGGFGECKYLQNAILDGFGHRTKVLIPLSAQLAIIKGAVLSGYMIGHVSSRIARHTYGCASMPYFDTSKHKNEKKVIIDGKRLCKDVLHVFVVQGECVEMGRPKIFGFRPPEKKAKWADFQLYRTNNDSVFYIDDPDVQKLGKITLRSQGRPLGNYLEIRITFGDTELLIEARDQDRGDKFQVSTTIDFQAD